MALLFSHVRASTPDGNEAEFLVMGIPREYEDLEGYTKLEEFLNELDEDTEISFHADAYLYGEGETFSASIEEVAYFQLRLQNDESFLSRRCDHIESVDFTCNYSPDELFGMDWG